MTYGNNNKSVQDDRLIHYVNKTHNLQCGIFGNISDDLGDVIKRNDLSPMVRMAYAYARRAVAAGLLYQGVFSLNDFRHVNDVFKSFQITTGHTVEFQESAFDQAAELTSTYDKRLDRKLLSLLVIGALDLSENSMEPRYLPGAPFSYDYVIDYFVKFSNSHSNNTSASSTPASTENFHRNSSNSTGCCVFLLMPIFFISMYVINYILGG